MGFYRSKKAYVKARGLSKRIASNASINFRKSKYGKAYSMFSRETKLMASIILALIFLYIIWYVGNYYTLSGLYAYVPSLVGCLLGAGLIIHKNYKTTFVGTVLMVVSCVMIAFQYGFVSV